MIRLTFFISLFLFSVTLWGQKPKVKNEPNHNDRPIHFGFSVGFNAMDFRVQHSQYAKDNNIIADISELQPGFNVQIVSNLRLSKYFDLRFMPGISFGGQRVLTFKQYSANTSLELPDSPIKLESNFIELPWLIKYRSSRINNFSPYLIGGFNIRYDLGPAARREYINEEDEKHYLILNRMDYYLEFGVGFDFYLVYFKLSTELKYCAGLHNVLSPTDKGGDAPEPSFAVYTDVIDKLYSNIFMVSFHFE